MFLIESGMLVFMRNSGFVRNLILSLATLLKRDFSTGVFPVNFVNFLRTPTLYNICERWLLASENFWFDIQPFFFSFFSKMRVLVFLDGSFSGVIFGLILFSVIPYLPDTLI